MGDDGNCWCRLHRRGRYGEGLRSRQELRHDGANGETSNTSNVGVSLRLTNGQTEHERVASTQTSLNGEERPLSELGLSLHGVLQVLDDHSVHGRSPVGGIEGWTLLTIVAVVLEVLGDPDPA